MSFEISRVDIWTGEVEDRPGALASKLAHLMMCAGANLECIIGRPAHDRPGCGVIFVAPISSPEQESVAREIGLHRSSTMHALRLIGPDSPGLAAGIAGTLAASSINIQGITAASARGTAILYLRFDSETDARRAAGVLGPHLCRAD